MDDKTKRTVALDEQAARALADAGYMLPSDYHDRYPPAATTDPVGFGRTEPALQAEPCHSRALTLRDLFAAQALLGVLTRAASGVSPKEMGKRAYMYADGMIEARGAADDDVSRMRQALAVAREFLEERVDIDNDGGPNAEMSALNEIKAILGEIP